MLLLLTLVVLLLSLLLLVLRGPRPLVSIPVARREFRAEPLHRFTPPTL